MMVLVPVVASNGQSLTVEIAETPVAVTVELDGPFGKPIPVRLVNGKAVFWGLAPGRYRIVVRNSLAAASSTCEVTTGERTYLYCRLSLDPSRNGRKTCQCHTWSGIFRQNHLVEPNEIRPTGLSIASFFERLDPAIVTEPMDFAGDLVGSSLVYSRGAASWTLNEIRIEGLKFSDPYQPGLVYYPLPAIGMDLIEVGSAESPGAAPLALESVEVFRVPQWAPFHARFIGNYSGSHLTSSTKFVEPSGDLTPNQLQWSRYYSARTDLSAGLKENLGWNLAAETQRGRRKNSWDQNEYPTRHSTLRASVDTRFGKGHYLGCTVFAGRRLKGAFGWPVGLEAWRGRLQSPPWRPSSRTGEEASYWSWVFRLHRVASAGGVSLAYRLGFIDGSVGTVQIGSAVRQELRTKLPVIDFVSGFTGRVPPYLGSGWRRSFQQAVNVSLPRSGQAAFGRFFSFSAEVVRSRYTNRWLVPGGANLITVGGNPALITEFGSSSGESRGWIWQGSLGIQGQLLEWRGLSTLAAFGVDYQAGQPVAASSAIDTLSPIELQRLSSTALRYSLGVRKVFWQGRLLVSASLARVNWPLAGRWLDFVDPHSLSGQEYQWTDLNGDRAFQPGERGKLLRRFGGRFSRADKLLRFPYTRSYAVGLVSDLPLGLRATVQLFRREDLNRIAAMNTGVPFKLSFVQTGESAHETIWVRDPGEDGLVGTEDDRLLPAFNQLVSTLGQDFFELRNVKARSFNAGVGASLEAEWRELVWRLSFVAEKGFGQTNSGNEVLVNDPGVVGSLYQEPNSFYLLAGRFFFDRAYIAKFYAQYKLPVWLGGFQVGLAARYFDGTPFARRLVVQELNQGPVQLLVTPRGSPEGGHRTQFHWSADVRIRRLIRWRKLQISPVMDIYNLNNAQKNLEERDWTSVRFFERLPLVLQPPRAVFVGLELSF